MVLQWSYNAHCTTSDKTALSYSLLYIWPMHCANFDFNASDNCTTTAVKPFSGLWALAYVLNFWNNIQQYVKFFLTLTINMYMYIHRDMYTIHVCMNMFS